MILVQYILTVDVQECENAINTRYEFSLQSKSISLGFLTYKPRNGFYKTHSP